MKWIFWTLLIFCLAFFGYQQWLRMQGEQSAPVVQTYQPPKQENVPSLKLVTELAPAERVAVQKPIEGGFEVPPAQPAAAPAAPVAPAAEPAPVIAKAVEPVKPEPVKAEPPKAAPVKPEAPAAPTIAQASPPAAPIPAPVQAEPAPAAATPPAVVLNLCPVVGPFRTKDSAEPWRTALAGSHFNAALHEVQLDKNPQHWVLLPAFASRELAQKKVVELLSKKIDAYVISEGDTRNAISLGLFDRIESAQAMQQRIKAAGYPAEIRPKPHKASEWWVKLVQPADPLKVKEALQPKLVGNDEVRIDPSKCD